MQNLIIQKLSYIFLLVLLSGAFIKAEAQTSNFTQYHLSPVYNSPGDLATSDYLQVLGHYRKQSLANEQGFKNMAISATYPLYYKDGGRRFGGIGLGIMTEASGAMGMLKETSIQSGYAYNWQITEKHHMSFGLQAGYFRRTIDASKVRTDSQYQNGIYVPGTEVGEDFRNLASHAFKADAGVTWYMLDEEGRKKYTAGLATFNVNRANYEYLDGEKQISEPIRYLAYGSMLAYEKDRIQIEPTFRFMFERNYTQLNVGSLFLYRFPPSAGTTADNHLGLGLWYSLNNAAIFSLQFMQADYVVSISYDLPASTKINQMQVNNGVELTLGWRMNRKK